TCVRACPPLTRLARQATLALFQEPAPFPERIPCHPRSTSDRLPTQDPTPCCPATPTRRRRFENCRVGRKPCLCPPRTSGASRDRLLSPRYRNPERRRSGWACEAGLSARRARCLRKILRRSPGRGVRRC